MRTSFLQLSFLLFSVIFMCYYYRRGGIVDQVYNSNETPGMRDVGVYIQAASQILDKNSPYSLSTLGFRAGSFGTLIFSFLELNSFGFVIAQLLNILGFLIFTIAVLQGRTSVRFIVIVFSLSIWFSSFREVFTTGQVTGIIFGFLGLGILLTKSDRISFNIASGLPFAIALDLKPNLVFFLILGVYIFTEKLRFVLAPVTTLVVGHLLVDLYVGKFLELEWFQTLNEISDSSNNPSSSGTRTIWPLLRSISGLNSIPQMFPTVLYCGLGFLTILHLYKFRKFNTFLILLLIPTLYNYFHLYSFLPIAVICVAEIVKNKQWLTLGSSLSFFLISGATISPQLMLISSVLAAYFLWQCVNEGYLFKVDSRNVCILFAVSILIRLLVDWAIEDKLFLEVINLNFLVLIAFYVFLKTGDKKELFDANSVVPKR